MYPTDCLTRNNDAFFSGDNQLSCLHWQQADKVEVRLQGHKVDQAREVAWS